MKGLLFSFALFYSSFSFAGSYTGKANIDWIGTMYEDSSGKYFTISGDWNNANDCSQMTDKIWKIYSENNSIEELNSMYSMALAAFMSGKTIELYSHKCGSDNRPNARSLFLPSRRG